MADFAGHVAFFIGQEEPEVAIAADQALLFESGKAFLYPALERQFVGIDFIDAERGQVVDVRFDDVRDVANQEHALEQVDVVGFQRGVARRFVDRALGAGVDEAFDRRIEVVERHEGVDSPVGIAHSGRLEGVEQRTLPFGEMLAGGADLADGFEDFCSSANW
jgi:hypothetical protein